MRNAARAVVPALLLAACGPEAGPDPAAEECEALFELVCDRVVECQWGGLTHEQCEAQFQMAMGDMQCEDADEVSASYDTCISDLMTVACATLFPTAASIEMPAACSGAILFEQ